MSSPKLNLRNQQQQKKLTFKRYISVYENEKVRTLKLYRTTKYHFLGLSFISVGVVIKNQTNDKVDLDNSKKIIKKAIQTKSDCHDNPLIPPPTTTTLILGNSSFNLP